MAKNEKTSTKVASVASKGLRTGKLTAAEIKSVSAAALTQAPDKPTRKKIRGSLCFLSDIANSPLRLRIADAGRGGAVW